MPARGAETVLSSMPTKGTFSALTLWVGMRSSKAGCDVRWLEPYGRKGQTHKVHVRLSRPDLRQK